MGEKEILQYTVEANIKFGSELLEKLNKIEKGIYAKISSNKIDIDDLKYIRYELNNTILWVKEQYKSDKKEVYYDNKSNARND